MKRVLVLLMVVCLMIGNIAVAEIEESGGEPGYAEYSIGDVAFRLPEEFVLLDEADNSDASSQSQYQIYHSDISGTTCMASWLGYDDMDLGDVGIDGLRAVMDIVSDSMISKAKNEKGAIVIVDNEDDYSDDIPSRYVMINSPVDGVMYVQVFYFIGLRDRLIDFSFVVPKTNYSVDWLTTMNKVVTSVTPCLE